MEEGVVTGDKEEERAGELKVAQRNGRGEITKADNPKRSVDGPQNGHNLYNELNSQDQLQVDKVHTLKTLEKSLAPKHPCARQSPAKVEIVKTEAPNSRRDLSSGIASSKCSAQG